MKSYLHKLVLFLSLSGFAMASAIAETQISTRGTESPYLIGTIKDIDYERDTLKFSGAKFRYTALTVIKFADQSRATEYNLTPGTPVLLLKKRSSKRDADGMLELSEIIIREAPAE